MPACMVMQVILFRVLRLVYVLSYDFITKQFFIHIAAFNYVANCQLLLRTPLSARSYRASMFLLD